MATTTTNDAAFPFSAALAGLSMLLLIRLRNRLGLLQACVANDFEYIAEGALNVTVRYVGQDSRQVPFFFFFVQILS